MTQVVAKLNYLRVAPRKVRLVADVIRGKSVVEAEIELRFLTKRASGLMLKLLRSAMANAEHNFSLQKANLRVEKVTVDGGPSLKRSRPRAFGRAAPIFKRTSHITMILSEIKELKGGSRAVRRKQAGPVIRKDSEAEGIRKEERRPERQHIQEKPIIAKRPMSVIRKVFQRKAV